jgi:zinc D-Ala-D-Ala carboxypeptidase
MQLTTNFSLEELCRSESAKRLGISNAPNATETEALKLLAENILQPLRNHFGPISISSGFRSQALNAATPGSAKNSQHSKGEAADIDMDNIKTNVTNAMVFDYIHKFMNYDQLIWEYGTDTNPDWVHVSFSAAGTQRKQALRCKRNAAGQPVYTNF